jgi:hypothetical protein
LNDGENAMPASRILHIVATDSYREGEIVVRFADGTSAIYQSEELEKLRLRRKDVTEERRIA